MQPAAWLKGVVALALVAGCSPPVQSPEPPAAPAVRNIAATAVTGRIVFQVFDLHGKRIDWRSFRRIADNAQDRIGLDDALIDPRSMVMLRASPLFSSDGSANGDPALDLSADHSAAALSIAWPTTLGYSDFIFVLPRRGGSYDFALLLAKQMLQDIADSLSTRSWYRTSKEFRMLYAKARRQYARALAASLDDQRGAYAARCVDVAVAAEMLLLRETGVAFAARHQAAAQWGATFDTITGGVRDLRTAASLYPKDGWLRICFDPGEKPAYYVTEIKRAHSFGLHVIGQILDSSEMRRWSVAAFEQRTRAYVDALPEVDEWETGNEVNGSWLGSIQSVVTKTAYASRYVKTHTAARVLVTLYWELGAGRPENATFNWARTNMRSFIADVDDLGLSLYPRQNPLGEPFDRVIGTLHRGFPQQRILISELDYDRGPGWWWGSLSEIAPAGRDAVAKTYQSAIMGYPYSSGGTFWWYFIEEVSRGNPLYRTFKQVYKASH